MLGLMLPSVRQITLQSPSRLLKKSSSFVLTLLRGSTYGTEYASPPRSLRPCWKVFLNSLRALVSP